MPITVSCPACGSRFSLSDDLYRRRVAGSLVKVKCRNCNAEIAVDATDPDTMPSQEAPQRKHPVPPRPRAITQMGLGTPPAPTELATSSPLPLTASVSLSPIATPLPHAEESIWSDDQTIAINAAKPPPRPAMTWTAATAAVEDDPELVDAEEVPVSSSGAPTLEALRLEAGGAHVPHGKAAPDEFLVSLSASDSILGGGNDALLSAPTIDVTSFAAEIDRPSADVALEEEEELEYRPARPARAAGSRFDLNALQAGLENTPALAESDQAEADPGIIEGRARERKFVIPPEAAATPRPAPKSRRALWVGLLAAAAAAGMAVGLRERAMRSAESAHALPAPGPVVVTQAALPAETTPTVEPSEALSATPSASVAAAVASAAPAAPNVAVATTRVTPSTVAAVKSSANASSTETTKPSSVPEATLEKPAVAVKPVEAHNAPPPAAPDTEFDRAAARNALASAATQASACRKEGDPSGTAALTIIFAPSGRVTSAQIQGPPFSGTATGGCIASTMRRASVPAFSGEHVTVSKTIVIQ